MVEPIVGATGIFASVFILETGCYEKAGRTAGRGQVECREGREGQSRAGGATSRDKEPVVRKNANQIESANRGTWAAEEPKKRGDEPGREGRHTLRAQRRILSSRVGRISIEVAVDTE